MAMDRERLLHAFEHQNIVLLVIGLVMAGMFAVTTLASRAYHSEETSLGRQWLSRGEMELQRGNASSAVQAFRNALAYNDVAEYRRRLAAALAQFGDTDEAREYLLNLWQSEPGDGTLNLQLARLAARTGNADDTLRYYQNAIYGVWPDNPEAHRREVRIELARFLLVNKRQQAARADLMALAADLPADPDLYTTVGRLFLDADDPANALGQFRMALRLNRGFGPALFGAGQAAYETGDYSTAAQYLEQASRVQPGNTAATDLLRTARLVVTTDPYEHGLSGRERGRRVMAAYNEAVSRLQICAQIKGIALAPTARQSPVPTTQMQSAATAPGSAPLSAPLPLQAAYSRLQQYAAGVFAAKLREDPDLADDIMGAVYESERVAAQVCGEPAGSDLALLLLAERNRK